MTVENNLLALDVERDFLDPFRKKDCGEGGGYVGLGKTIEAAVRFAAYTKMEKVRALKKHLVEEVIKTQEADGYIGIMPKGGRMWRMWDLSEIGYMIMGLTVDHQCFHERASLNAACKLADYVIQHWHEMPSDWSSQTHYAVTPAVIGLDRAMVALHCATGEQRFLSFCIEERSLTTSKPDIVIGRRELMEGDDSAYLSQALAQLELQHFLHPNCGMAWQAQRAVRFMTDEDGMCITGATGLWEVWTDDQDGRGGLGETCATVYEVLLFDRMLQVGNNPIYGDLLERTIYNTLFAAQSPDGRRLRYYTPMEGDREYFPQDTYCCPCNYRRAVSALPGMVYYLAKGGLAVNLYTQSKATVRLNGDVTLDIRQETDYPNSGHVMLRLEPSRPANFQLLLRIPRWCDNAIVLVNGQPLDGPVRSGSFFKIDQQWKAGDQVTLDMPMSWRLVLGRKRQAGRAAVMRGPLVFGLDPTQDESLRKLDGADLGHIVIDPDSLEDAPGGDDLHSGGIACQAKAGRGGTGIQFCSGLSLHLTRFIDPQSKCVYFRLPDLRAAKPDKLLSGYVQYSTQTRISVDKGMDSSGGHALTPAATIVRGARENALR